MELVYFLLSFIEIILTCYLVFQLTKLDLKVQDCCALIESKLPKIEKTIKSVKQILSITAKISIAYKKIQDFEKYLSKISKLKGVIQIINLIQGKKSKNKFRIFPLIKKYLFYM